MSTQSRLLARIRKARRELTEVEHDIEKSDPHLKAVVPRDDDDDMREARRRLAALDSRVQAMHLGEQLG